VILQALIGMILILAAFLFIFKKEKVGFNFAYIALLVTIVVINLLVFYYEQFSTIINVVIQFILFTGILRYRQRFLVSNKSVPQES